MNFSSPSLPFLSRGVWLITIVVGLTERSLDTVACQDNSDLDGLRADYPGSDSLVAGDKDDLVGVAAK